MPACLPTLGVSSAEPILHRGVNSINETLGAGLRLEVDSMWLACGCHRQRPKDQQYPEDAPLSRQPFGQRSFHLRLCVEAPDGCSPWLRAAILRHLTEAVAENGIDDNLRFNMVSRQRKVGQQPNWTRTVRQDDTAPTRMTCRFLWICAGYCRPAKGYIPHWPIHP
jgi:hypothetical protein